MYKKKGITAEVVATIIKKVGGPVYTGTKADKVKRHYAKAILEYTPKEDLPTST